MKTIYWHPTGPFVRYANGFLHVSDLNPEINTRWQMSRREMFVCGVRFILAAVSR